MTTHENDNLVKTVIYANLKYAEAQIITVIS